MPAEENYYNKSVHRFLFCFCESMQIFFFVFWKIRSWLFEFIRIFAAPLASDGLGRSQDSPVSFFGLVLTLP